MAYATTPFPTLGRLGVKLSATAFAAAALLLATAPAEAHDRGRQWDRGHHQWDRGHGHGYHQRYDRSPRVNVNYVSPRPYYYNPRPVYYAPPPVYYAPAPVYYTPAPAYYGHGGGYTSISFGWR